MPDRFTMPIAVHLFLFKGDKILLLRRQNTGYEDGNYSVPAGHVEADETPTHAMIRETKEEAGLDLQADQLQFAHVLYRKTERERVDFFFTCREWTGEPYNAEEDKCDQLIWVDKDSLPPNTIPYIAHALAQIKMGAPFSEFKLKN